MSDVMRTEDDGEVLTVESGDREVALVSNACHTTLYFVCSEGGRRQHAGIVDKAYAIGNLMRWAMGEPLDDAGLVLG